MEVRLSENPAIHSSSPRQSRSIRLFDVPNRPFPTPQSTFPVSERSGKWLECKPETVINFSAVGYFFGRDIQKSQNVPVGLIAADWGGTPAEAWTSLGGLKAEAELGHYVKTIERVHNEPEAVQVYEYRGAIYVGNHIAVAGGSDVWVWWPVPLTPPPNHPTADREEE